MTDEIDNSVHEGTQAMIDNSGAGPGPDFVATPLAAFRAIDPGARLLWDVQGPRDNASRLECYLVKVGGNRREIVVQVFTAQPAQPWNTFYEVDAAGRNFAAILNELEAAQA